jgi:hypothetical protein
MKNIEYITDCISHVINVSNNLKIKFYIYGGIVQDIMEGKLLRRHSTIHMFMENMDDNIEYIMKYLKEKGLSIDYCEYLNSLHIGKYYIKGKKEYVKIIITTIKFNGKTAIWKYLGEQGFINFPKKWLDNESRKFYNLDIFTSGVNLEYCYRIFFRYIHPKWWHEDRAEKHIKAIDFYENKLIENNINPYKIFEKIWCYSPYWYKEGFSGYEEPVLVLGKDVFKNHHRTTRLMKIFKEKNINV